VRDIGLVTFLRDAARIGRIRRRPTSAAVTSATMTQSAPKMGDNIDGEIDHYRQALGPFVVAVESTRMPMVFTDAAIESNPIIFANESFLRLMLCERSDILGEPFGSVLAHGSKSESLERIAAALAGDEEQTLQLRCRRYDGTEFLAGVYITAVHSKSGRITQYFASFVDLTHHFERLSLESEVIHLSRVSAMGTMAATIAHELNQPLSSISNYVSGCRHLLEAREVETGKLDEALTGIGESSARAGEIIRHLRAMTAKRPGQQEDFDIADVVRESLRLCDVASKGISVAVNITDGGRVSGDRVQLQQVIINLVQNACESLAGSTAGRVLVSTDADPARVIVSIEDSGPGVSVDAAGTLFDWSDSSKPGGMGIGLAISRTIIEAHHGQIWFEEGESGGARFCFSLARAA